MSAAPGNVNIQAETIRWPQTIERHAGPGSLPPLTTAPPIACVVEIGTETIVAYPIVVAAASSAEKPPIGCRCGVMRDPIVLTILHPPSNVPTAHRLDANRLVDALRSKNEYLTCKKIQAGQINEDYHVSTFDEVWNEK